MSALRMAFFRNFKLPQFLKKQQSSAESIANIKVFDCNALQVKKRLGQGAFGDVYTTDYGTEENVKTVVVKTSCLDQWVFVLDHRVFVLDQWVFVLDQWVFVLDHRVFVLD